MAKKKATTDGPVIEKQSAVKAEREAKKDAGAVIVGAFDTTLADVLKYVQDGKEIYFSDKKDDFLYLPDEVLKVLPQQALKRYRVSKEVYEGGDPIGVSANSRFDMKRDFNTRRLPVGMQTQVQGKDPKFDYYWERSEQVDAKRMDGWEVDTDENVKTYVNDGKVKFIGGSAKPEMVLMRIPKEVRLEQKTRKRRIVQDRLDSGQQKAFEATLSKLGSKFVSAD